MLGTSRTAKVAERPAEGRGVGLGCYLVPSMEYPGTLLKESQPSGAVV